MESNNCLHSPLRVSYIALAGLGCQGISLHAVEVPEGIVDLYLGIGERLMI